MASSVRFAGSRRSSERCISGSTYVTVAHYGWWNLIDNDDLLKRIQRIEKILLALVSVKEGKFTWEERRTDLQEEICALLADVINDK